MKLSFKQWNILRIFLVSLLVTQIVLSPFLMHKAYATSAPVTAMPVSASNPSATLPEPSAQEQAAQTEEFKRLYANLLGSNQYNPLDYFSLLRQDYFSENKSGISISSNSVMIRTYTQSKISDGSMVKRYDHSFTAKESLLEVYDGLLANNFVGGHAKQAKAHGFEIYISGKLLHSFRVPIEAIAVLGNYIVFVEQNSYSAKGNYRHLSFIDLEYFQLAKAELPIFRVPIDATQTIQSFVVNKKNLYINDREFNIGLFDFATSMQRVLFNLNVNLTEPESLLSLFDNSSMFLEYFQRNLQYSQYSAKVENQKTDYDFAGQKLLEQLQTSSKENVNSVKNSSEAMAQYHDLISKNFFNELEAKQKVQVSRIEDQRKLSSRLAILWQMMTIPKPAMVSSLKDNIVRMAVGIYKKDLTKATMLEVAQELATNKSVRYSVATLAAAASAYYYPDQSLQALLSTTNAIIQLGDATFAKAAELGTNIYEASVSTVKGFSPFVLYEVYIADGAWRRTAVGLSSLMSILGVVLLVPHVLVNTYYLTKDMNSDHYAKWELPKGTTSLKEFIYLFQYYSLSENAKSFKLYLKAMAKQMIPNFIQRQKIVREEYLVALVDKPGPKVDTSGIANLSAEELAVLDQQAKEFLEQNKKTLKKQKSFSTRIQNSPTWQKLGALVKNIHFALPQFKPNAKLVNAYNNMYMRFANIHSFAQALSSFLFSFASFTRSAVFYASSWNYIFLLRTLVFYPKLAHIALMYPNYLKVAVSTDLGNITPPSFWNGGKRWVWQEIGLSIQSIYDRDIIPLTKAFEDEIIKVEQEIHKNVLHESFKALQAYLSFKQKNVEKMSIYPDAGKRLTSNYMAELSYDARSFFNVYYNLLLDRSMTSYLKAQAAEQAQSIGAAGAGQALQAFTEIDLEKSSRFDLKNWFVANSVNPSAGSANAQQIVKSFSEQNSFYDEAYNIAHSSKGVVTKTLSNSEHANYWNLDPQHSGQFKRYTVAKTQLKKFGAVARAVRSSIAAQLVDKPMELLLLFILVAGVDSGPNKPLWDEMFSQDSAFYMSKNVFISYLTGVVISIFADVWVKVQTDVRVEKLGGFDSIPSGKDAKRSFNSWYWHEFRHNEKNKWWDHHKEYSSLIYHNMKPALVLMAITGFINLGRLDADFWVMGYAFAFLLPFSGLSLKLEQTYEIASGWVMRNVPENLRKHPLILEWANKESTKLRIQFQLYYKLYENILGQWLNNIMAVTTAVSGTRGFTRAVFGGKTVTEHIIEKTTELRSLSFPGAKYVDKACRILFSGNYNSGKLPDEPND